MFSKKYCIKKNQFFVKYRVSMPNDMSSGVFFIKDVGLVLFSFVKNVRFSFEIDLFLFRLIKRFFLKLILR